MNEPLEKIMCCNCGIEFWIHAQLAQYWRDSRREFFCPNGHGQVFKKSMSDILREQLEVQTKRANDRLDDVDRLEAEIARLERRIKRLTPKKK